MTQAPSPEFFRITVGLYSPSTSGLTGECADSNQEYGAVRARHLPESSSRTLGSAVTGQSASRELHGFLPEIKLGPFDPIEQRRHFWPFGIRISCYPTLIGVCIALESVPVLPSSVHSDVSERRSYHVEHEDQ
jgi:hypothetical protein